MRSAQSLPSSTDSSSSAQPDTKTFSALQGPATASFNLTEISSEVLFNRLRRDPNDSTARNELVERYLPIVKYNGERIWARLPEGVELDDLIQSGTFGLMDAITAFDPTRGVKFETYCVPRIRGAMLDELRSMDWVPRLVRSKASKLNAGLRTLETKLGRAPTEVELASHLEISVNELEKMASDANAVGVMSLDKKWHETDSFKDVREIDILVDARASNPSKHAEDLDLMRSILRGLNQNERIAFICYFYEEMTMKEIGQQLGLSESRVSQLMSAAE